MSAADGYEVPRDSPPWAGRPQGRPLGVVVEEQLLAQSERAEVRIAYVDAYPEGFELVVSATASVSFDALRREVDPHAPDIFGGHWPMAGERSDVLPPSLLRIGVQFSDRRTATNIIGHDRPSQGPVIRALGGAATGGPANSHFQQGYWISPPPPPGPVTIICEWPALGIPLTRFELDAQQILDAAERSRGMFPDGHRVSRDGREWRLGTAEDIAWINDGTIITRAITSGVPPVFDAYCTLELPRGGLRDPELDRHERAVGELLTAHTEPQPWWLGYLDTGASDVVFPYAPRVTLYAGWGYVLVEAGPQQATTWRDRDRGFNWALPELIFPADRSWLVSTLWDDDWTCIGGSDQLVESVLNHPTLKPRARRVTPDEDATPPGHRSI